MKAISFVLVLSLIFCLCVGCSFQEKSTDTMTAETELEIREAWYEKETEGGSKYFTVDDVWVLCIAAYGEVYAVYIGGINSYVNDWHETKSIGGVAFSFSDDKIPYIYKGGFFFSLEKAYEEGILTVENLEHLHGEYNKFGSMPYQYYKSKNDC